MINDYNSFIQGVITGLKLGRVPEGRTPPVPSGKYILTESGNKVLSEKVISTDATLYRFGETYNAVVYSSDTGDTILDRGTISYIKHSGGDTSNLCIFYVQLTDISGGARGRVTMNIGGECDFDSYQLRWTYDGPEYSEFGWFNISGVKQYALQYGGYGSYLGRCVPEDAVTFKGTKAELELYIAGLSNIPMITE